MTWREKVVVHILLLVAQMLTDDAATADAIKKLSTHVSVNAPKPEPVEAYYRQEEVACTSHDSLSAQ